MEAHPYADLALSRRLERCEAEAGAALVEARAVLDPQSGAVWMECDGTYALFDGVDSPLTQTFGLGLFSTPTESDFDLIEQFFAERGATVAHEVSPLAAPETFVLLAQRGYRAIEFTSILYRPIDDVDAYIGAVQTRRIRPGEEQLWADTAAQGWSEHPEVKAFISSLGRVLTSSRRTTPFFAELEGDPIGTGAMTIHERTVLLAGASTIPSRRKLGAQRALLQTRLRYAAEQGCDLAAMGAQPGSTSQRNAERQQFRIAYTRVKWSR